MQPFIDDESRPFEVLTLKPGFAIRGLGAASTHCSCRPRGPARRATSTATVRAVLPSIEGNYAFTPAPHGYLQWSKGSLVRARRSSTGTIRTIPRSGIKAQPQTSPAVQGGFIYADGPVSFTANAYWVELKNYISSTTDANKNTVLINNGRVRYRGIKPKAMRLWVWVGLGWSMRA